MKHSSIQSTETLGADLRALRKARGFTLAALAEKLDRSVGWLSQVERDKSELSTADLRVLARELDVSVASLSHQDNAPENEQGYIVRANARRPIGSRADGLVEELLSPDLTDDFEMVHSNFAPGSHITKAVTRPTQEVGYLLSGTLELTISGTSHTLNAGDSFRIRGEAFTWSNPGKVPAIAIWVIAPPVY